MKKVSPLSFGGMGFLYFDVLGLGSLDMPLKRMCGYLSLELPPHKAWRV
jgi:hypothetical protein